MNKNAIKLCALAITGALFITSCSNEEETIGTETAVLETENAIQFEAMDELNNGQQESLKRVLTKGGGKTDRTITQMVISIEDDNGNPVYEDELIPVINQNGNIVDLAETFAEHLPDLTAESYTITKIVFLNEECTPLYAVPTVTSPLISETTVVLSLPQVMTRHKKTGLYKFHVMRSLFITEDRNAEDFGYESLAPSKIPDFALTITELSTTRETKEMLISIEEINGAPSLPNRPISIELQNFNWYPISFDPNLTTTSEGVAVNNSDWILVGEPKNDGVFTIYKLEYVGNSGIFNPNSVSHIAFSHGYARPGGGIGYQGAHAIMTFQSGGDENFYNDLAPYTIFFWHGGFLVRQ